MYDLNSYIFRLKDVETLLAFYDLYIHTGWEILQIGDSKYVIKNNYKFDYEKNEITTVIPPESISVPLILHGILEQVEVQIETNTNNTKISNQQDDIGRYLQEKLKILSTGKDQQKVRDFI